MQIKKIMNQKNICQKIEEIFVQDRSVYGSPRIYQELKKLGEGQWLARMQVPYSAIGVGKAIYFDKKENCEIRTSELPLRLKCSSSKTIINGEEILVKTPMYEIEIMLHKVELGRWRYGAL